MEKSPFHSEQLLMRDQLGLMERQPLHSFAAALGVASLAKRLSRLRL